MGHVAVVVEGTWGESLLVFHGGLSEDKVALQDMAVMQLGAGSWLRPQPVRPGPPARSFHCGAALASSFYIFGGHVWHRDTREIRKFHDLWRLDTVREEGSLTLPLKRKHGFLASRVTAVINLAWCMLSELSASSRRVCVQWMGVSFSYLRLQQQSHVPIGCVPPI